MDEGLVRELLREQHPDLAGLELRRVPGGWDNQLWRLGQEFGVRLPRSERAPGLLRKEWRWLPVLAPRLPLPVPVPVRVGEPSARFPQPWAVTRWVPGEPADRVPVAAGRGAAAADALAGFLGALHEAAPVGAPANPKRGVPLGGLRADFERAFEVVAGEGRAEEVRRVWEEAVAAGDRVAGPPVWLHGDLHPANAVVAEGTLAGVIDFGELCAGDPATDLAAAWLLLPEGGAGRLFERYPGPVDEAAVRRARGWAVLRALSMIGIGLAWERGLPGGQPTWGAAGRAALARVLGAGRAGEG